MGGVTKSSAEPVLLSNGQLLGITARAVQLHPLKPPVTSLRHAPRCRSRRRDTQEPPPADAGAAVRYVPPLRLVSARQAFGCPLSLQIDSHIAGRTLCQAASLSEWGAQVIV